VGGLAGLLAAGAVFLWVAAASAQQLVHFPSFDDNGPRQPATGMFFVVQARENIRPWCFCMAATVYWAAPG
jgi:hypothetical protein